MASSWHPAWRPNSLQDITGGNPINITEFAPTEEHVSSREDSSGARLYHTLQVDVDNMSSLSDSVPDQISRHPAQTINATPILETSRDVSVNPAQLISEGNTIPEPSLVLGNFGVSEEAKHTFTDLSEAEPVLSSAPDGRNRDFDLVADLGATTFQEQMDAAFLDADLGVEDITVPINQSNEFPLVNSYPEIELPQALPKTQAELILEDSSTPIYAEGSFFPAETEAEWPTMDDTVPMITDKMNGPESVSYASDRPKQEELDQSRHDEGIPLIKEVENEGASATLNGANVLQSNPSATSATWSMNQDQNNDLIHDEDFRETMPVLRDILQRKSTSEASGMDKIFSEAAQSDDGSLQKQDDWPAEESVWENIDSIHQSPSAPTASLENADELADLWKAALADDDLLEEDESTNTMSFFEDDGEGFLDDELLPQSAAPDGVPDKSSQIGALQDSEPATISRPRTSYLPAQGTSLLQAAIPTAEVVSPMSGGGQGQYPSSISTSGLNKSLNARPSLPNSAQSFADKSKGGYTSPYDLPMDLTRPKKRQQLPSGRSESPHIPNDRPPPARSTSMYNGPSGLSGGSSAPPLIMPTENHSGLPYPRPSTSGAPSQPQAGSFFEELPIVPKSRPASSMARAHTAVSSPPILLPPTNQQYHSVADQTPKPTSNQHFGLLPPERLSLYAEKLAQPASKQPVMAVNSRYSPAPPPSSNTTIPPPLNRYASSPMAPARPIPQQAMRHQPRTSSPLAQSSSQDLNTRQISEVFEQDREISSTPSLPTSAMLHAGVSMQVASGQSLQHIQNNTKLPASMPPIYAPLADLDPASTNYRDMHSDQDSAYTFMQYGSSQDLMPGRSSDRPLPERTQTTMPDVRPSQVKFDTMAAPYSRPPSASSYHVSRYQPQETSMQIRDQSVKQYSMAEPNDLVRPVDGRELDPLERWKGCPIVSFGFGGAVVKSFPQRVPRYSAGSKIPIIKCSPGEVKVDHGNTLNLDPSVISFPGPLKAKGSKKDVMEWLRKRIDQLEQSATPAQSAAEAMPDPHKCWEEQILLWKTLSIFLEHDGVIKGNPLAEASVRLLLSPELGVGDTVSLSQHNGDGEMLGIRPRSPAAMTTVQSSAAVVEDLRKMLMRADREKAVWHAVDNRLWSHAMLLSSTLDPKIWRQVIQEFIHQEVKIMGDNSESLAALYQVLAGNCDECVDELIPPSARAGLQMVSKTSGAGPTKNALNGLDRWRETLTLILANRTSDDERAIIALGRLLSAYGRTAAAHICYLFVDGNNLFGGQDDPGVAITLLGADHERQPFDFGRDFDSILLTEIHEYTRTILVPGSTPTVTPHLQAYRLYHAIVLADHGHKTESQAYCDAIISTLKSTTKPSSYYHSLLTRTLDELQERLRQNPQNTSGSWISKPSIDKVSGSMWAKFNSYVAGDDDETASTGSGKALGQPNGPFGLITTDSPIMSRPSSSQGLYPSHSSTTNFQGYAPPPSNRYAPNNNYASRTSSEQLRYEPQSDTMASNLSHDPPKSIPSQLQPYPMMSRSSSYEPHTKQSFPTSNPGHLSPTEHRVMSNGIPSRPTSHAASDSGSSNHQAPLHYLHQDPNTLTSVNQQSPPYNNAGFKNSETIAVDADRSDPVYSGYAPSSGPSPEHLSSSFDQTSINTYDPAQPEYSTYDPRNSYEPPSYEPPTYDPDITEEPVSSEEAKPKKSIMNLDDDDEFEARAAAVLREEKARKDREADEAFRKAAEADAQKGGNPKLNNKKSWFGPWFGANADGKKSETSDPNKPVKVKLGEANSFVYDENLKKWVNKKAGAVEESTTTPMAPPPRGPPSRSVSAAGVPSKSSTPAPPVPPIPRGMGAGTPPVRAASATLPHSFDLSNGVSRTSSPAMMPQSMSESAIVPPAPPSRPSTAQSGASGIDDLIGAPQPRAGGTVRKGKKARGYVDVMAN